MASSQFLDIVLIAMVAGVILFRLYTVLGRRTMVVRVDFNLLRQPCLLARAGW